MTIRALPFGKGVAYITMKNAKKLGQELELEKETHNTICLQLRFPKHMGKLPMECHCTKISTI